MRERGEEGNKGKADNMEFGINTAMTVGSILLGAGIAWATLKAWVHSNTAKVDKIEKSLAAFHGTTTENPGAQPMYIRRAECEKTSGGIKENIKEMSKTVSGQGESIERVVNYARWQMTTKDGLNLAEANEILENGN